LLTWLYLFACFALCFETGLHYIAQAGLELAILSQPPECWDYRQGPLHLVSYNGFFFNLFIFISYYCYAGGTL
jgi:hypothetical protein